MDEDRGGEMREYNLRTVVVGDLELEGFQHC